MTISIRCGRRSAVGESSKARCRHYPPKRCRRADIGGRLKAPCSGTAVTVLLHPGDNWMMHVVAEQIEPGDVVVAACSPLVRHSQHTNGEGARSGSPIQAFRFPLSIHYKYRLPSPLLSFSLLSP